LETTTDAQPTTRDLAQAGCNFPERFAGIFPEIRPACAQSLPVAGKS